jgi:hypothetical protein
VLKNNCQHFASYLIQILTGDELRTRTISDLMKNFVPWSRQPTLAPLRSTSAYTGETHRHNIFPRIPPTHIMSNLEWLKSGSNLGHQTSISLPPFAGLAVSRLQLDGFRACLQDGERRYLDTLGFGEPQLLQDYFLITDDPPSNRVSRAVCALYRDVFLLCRYVPSSSIRSWDSGSSIGPTNPVQERERLFVYGYLYSRHINNVTRTGVGNFTVGGI